MIFLIVESFHTERLYWPIVREMGETAIENEQNLLLCWEKGCNYVLLEDAYEIRLEDVLG